MKCFVKQSNDLIWLKFLFCDCGLSARKCNVRIWFVMPCFNQTPGRIRVVFFFRWGGTCYRTTPYSLERGLPKHLTNKYGYYRVGYQN